MRILALPVFALFLSASTSFAGSLDINYDINMGGARIMAADFQAVQDGGSYSGAFKAKTTGVSKLFSKVRLKLDVQGAVQDESLRPSAYSYERSKNGKSKTRDIRFTGKGKVQTDGQDYPTTLLPALDGVLTDPISGVLSLALTAKPCNVKLRGFDGRDVFDISTKPKSSGDGRVVCTLTYTPVAGNDVDEGDTDSKSYELTLVKGAGDFPYIPVSLSGSSKGVPFDVTATSVSIDGSALNY